jgi:hypothetical protein
MATLIRILATAAAVALAVVLIFVTHHWLRERFPAETSGQIFVNGPQVYTRERLVNDRYQEDAWLNKMLEATSHDDKFGDKFGYRLVTESRDTDQLVATLRAKLVPPAVTPPAPDTPAKPIPPDAGSDQILKEQLSPRINPSPTYQLQALRAYREQIRVLLIENQLDDRHDLRGNSLYRLRFDATVLPGNNTHAAVKVFVRITPRDFFTDWTGKESFAALNNAGASRARTRPVPPPLTELTNPATLTRPQYAAWRNLYESWLASLEARFDHERAGLAVAYYTGRFSPDDYDLMLAYLRDELDREIRALHARGAGLGNAAAALTPAQEDILRRAPAVSQEVLNGLNVVEERHIEAFRRAFLRGENHADIDQHILLDDDQTHAIYRREIDRLIGELNAVVDLAGRLEQLTCKPSSPPIADSGQASAPSCDTNYTSGLARATRTREAIMDRVFQDKVFRSVLGIDPGLSGLEVAVPYSVKPFADVYYFPGKQLRSFRFVRKTQVITVTNDNSATCVTDKNIRSDLVERRVPNHDHPVFMLKKDLEALDALEAQTGGAYDLGPDLAKVADEWSNDRDNPCHQEGISLEIGLVNFVRKLGRAPEIYTYAIPAIEPDDLIASRARAESIMELHGELTAGGGGPQGGVEGTAAHEFLKSLGYYTTRMPVVGFGDRGFSGVAAFGWVIQPREPDLSNTRLGYRQSATQNALTALVSLPAWWNRVDITISKAWLSNAGTREEPVGSVQSASIELPTNFETVDASLFESSDRGPVISDWVLPREPLRPCTAFKISITGRRLWRSTVVSLGSQVADAITVMPNMNGIIATFGRVEIPADWTMNASYLAPLTVWTSQGNARLPRQVEIGKPDAPIPNGRCPAPLVQSSR